MNQGNKGNSVQKASPEESAILQNIAALVQELQASGAVGAAPQAEPDGDEAMQGMGFPPVQKGSEQDRTEAPQNVMQPGAAPKEQGTAPWEKDDEVKKAMKLIAKSIMSSQTDGPAANEAGEKRVEDLPDTDEENIKEVAKALLKLTGKQTVAKSQNSGRENELMSVIKSLNDRIAQQGAIIGEILEGLGAPLPQAPAQVQKSQNAPYSGIQGSEMVDLVAQSVAKALQMSGGMNRPSGIPMAQGFGNVQKSDDMQQFVQEFGDDAGWARPVN